MTASNLSQLDAATGPLAGIRVIDLTINVLGPVATQILGDMGADVIKVEAPGGDDMRRIGPARSHNMGAFFLSMNRNKRSIVLDLKEESARDTLVRLSETADVFVHSMRPSAAERLGIGYAALSARNASLVYASAGGYRNDSSRRDWPAFDDVIQAASGIAAMNERDGEPRYFPTVICDKLCGYILASTIGMALFARERRGGEGQEVHVAMMDAMVGFNMVEHIWGGAIDEPDLGMGYSRMLSVHRRPYRSKDGFVAVLAVNDGQWERLFQAIGQPELAADARFATMQARVRNIDELYGLIGAAIAQRTTAEWGIVLADADIPHGPVEDFQQLYRNDYLHEHRFFRHLDHPSEGRITAMGPPAQFSATPASVHRFPPRLGENTDEILRELGSR
ncbi:CaiB/BaiF CoA transferase family protein [Tardiphaga sp.]|jgi:crotonobetainyl-CoA:carnitine CoA-transferase CaiB-like acyl-CoA transferase